MDFLMFLVLGSRAFQMIIVGVQSLEESEKPVLH